MADNYLISDDEPKLSISSRSKYKSVGTYEIMHKEKIVATISTTGRATVYDEKFMPYDYVLKMKKI